LPPAVSQIFKKFKWIISKISMLLRDLNLDDNTEEQFDVIWDAHLGSSFGTGKLYS
jgi:hypothetical protein